MTALQHLYPKYRAHAASTIHRRRYSPQSFVYTVVLFSALGLAGYFYRSDPTLHTARHSYTTLDRRDVGLLASTDEEVRLDLLRNLIHISDNPHSVDSSTRPPINVAT
jgi:sodium/potassium/calcium exchanger 6